MDAPALLDIADLGEWRVRWDELVVSSPLPSPFLRSWWLTGGDDPGRHFLLVVDGEHLLGGLALEERGRTSSIHMMGDGSLCPDHLDLLASPGREAVVIDLVRGWLGRPGGRIYDLHGLPAGSLVADALPGRVRRLPEGVAPYLPLPETAGAYRAALPSQFRRNLRRADDRLTTEGVTHRVLRRHAVPGGLATLRELHENQWGDRSQFLPAFDSFASRCTSGAAVDEVAVHELATDQEVVATVVTFELAGRVSLYQSARRIDPRWRDATTVLLAGVIDDACERCFREVDFLRGDEPYKSRFTPHRRELVRLVAGTGLAGKVGGVSRSVAFRLNGVAVTGGRAARSTAARWKHPWRGPGHGAP